MAFEYGIKDNENIMKSITPDDAINVFENIMQKNIPRLIVGELNFKKFKQDKGNIKFQLSKDILSELDQAVEIQPGIKQMKKVNSKDVVLSGSDNVYNPTEKTVAALWSEILGLKEVNVYETFNSLGGDSIMAAKLLKVLDREYPNIVDIADIFNFSTVNELSHYIEEKIRKEDNSEPAQQGDDIDNILDMLAKGELSVNDLV